MKLNQLLVILAFSILPTVSNAMPVEDKLQLLDEIYTRIYNAMGLNEDRPVLKLDTRRSRSVAYIKKNKDGTKTIAVEEKAFDVCLALEGNTENALAFLLAHELGHFRYDHHWGGDFASSFAIEDIQDEIAEASKKLGELKFYETQADQMGGIYCYLAGYNIKGIGEVLLPKIYEAYGLSEENKRYPSLDQRVEISKVNDAAMEQLIHVYEAGTYSLLLGEYAEARRCLQHCLNEGFKSREVYNNIGVANFLEAAELIGHDEVIYAYPIELDVEARIESATKGFATDITEMLQDAVKKFDQAILFDPEYATGYVNKACALSLLGELEDAEYFAKKGLRYAKETGNTNSAGNALGVLGIVYAQMDEKDDAIEELKKGTSEYNNYFCEVNMDVVKGKSLKSVEWLHRANESLAEMPEELDIPAGKSPREALDGVVDFMSDLEGEELEEIKIYKGSCYYLYLDNSKIVNLTSINDEELFYQITDASYTGTTGRGISIGTESKKVLKKYGGPNIIIPSRTGLLYYYEKPKIVFFIKEDVVEKWMVYKTY